MKAPEFEPNGGWINTPRSLSLHSDLRGCVVLLEFFAPGHSACDEVLADLRWFAEKFAREPFVIVGVMAAESAADADRDRATHAVRRRRVGHPVVIDREWASWRAYGVKQWPTMVLIDPGGGIVGQVAGAGHRTVVDRYITRLLADGRVDRTLAAGRPDFGEREAEADGRGLWYPAGVAAVSPAVGEPGALIIADTGRDRLVVTAWPDAEGRAAVWSVIGGGRGFADGAGGAARFDEPRGVSPVSGGGSGGGRVLVADVRNHAVRLVELRTGSVRTLAGTGRPLEERGAGGASGPRQALHFPAAAAIDERRQRALVAMAGDDRVWSVDLTTMVTRVLAGSGEAGVVDGPMASARFRQPGGVAVSEDGSRVWVVDTLGGAVREIDAEGERVRTVVGRVRPPADAVGVLAEAGDADGSGAGVGLRMPQGVATWSTTPMDPRGERLLVADAGNGKIRLVDPFAGTSVTWAEGLAWPTAVAVARSRHGAGAASVFVAETDAHRIVRIDPATGARTAIEIDGL